MGYIDDPYNTQGEPSAPTAPYPAPTGKIWTWDDNAQMWVLKDLEDPTVGSSVNLPAGSGREVARVADASGCGNYPGTVAVKLPNGGYACVLKSSMPKAETTTPTTPSAPRPMAAPSRPQTVKWWVYPQTGDTRIVESVLGDGDYSNYLAGYRGVQ